MPSQTQVESVVPLVTVVVVNWNRRDFLLCCLRSLAVQRGVEFEVIVIDNGSEDGSPEAAEALQQCFRGGLQVIRNNTNRGFCGANNQGIAIARGQYIALLNNDAEADPEWLSSMTAAIADRTQTGMVACKILVYEDPTKIDKAGHLIWPDGQNRGRGTGETDRGQYDREEPVLWPDGCAALYRAQMLDEIGGFDEDLFAYGDDAELGLRARIAGWQCIYTPAAVVRHHRGATLGVRSSRRIELIERNRILLAVRHFPLSLLLLNIPWFAARLGAGFSAGLRGRGEAAKFAGVAEQFRLARALLNGFREGVSLIPHTWRKRKAPRAPRRLSDKEILQLLFANKISIRALTEDAV
ncbi:MAG: glycosyltransferase family 2 protein [Bryobacteraceae bacterium]|nr:glycosyltransferase family 2 protein [Bryobacteraceae bacterium]